MLSAKGSEDTHPHAQGLEAYAPKSNRMTSGLPVPTKSKPWIDLRICALQQSFPQFLEGERADLGSFQSLGPGALQGRCRK